MKHDKCPICENSVEIIKYFFIKCKKCDITLNEALINDKQMKKYKEFELTPYEIQCIVNNSSGYGGYRLNTIEELEPYKKEIKNMIYREIPDKYIISVFHCTRYALEDALKKWDMKIINKKLEALERKLKENN